MNKLQIGCFDRPADGWTNTDITPHLWITRVPLLPTVLHAAGKMTDERLEQHRQGVFRKVERLDVTKAFPYASGSFQAVFCAHLLEHLYPDQAERCAREVYRVLAPGGVFRVSVPDLDHMVDSYEPEGADAWVEAFFEVRQARDKNRHHWMYNGRTMGEMLLKAGFSRAERRRYREGLCPDLDILDNRPESLFMEGIK